MDIRPIKTEADYQAALEEIERLCLISLMRKATCVNRAGGFPIAKGAEIWYTMPSIIIGAGHSGPRFQTEKNGETILTTLSNLVNVLPGVARVHVSGVEVIVADYALWKHLVLQCQR